MFECLTRIDAATGRGDRQCCTIAHRAPRIAEPWRQRGRNLHNIDADHRQIRLASADDQPLVVPPKSPVSTRRSRIARTFQIDLDPIEHALQISVDDGRQEVFALQPRSVADFYAELMGRMRSLGLDVRIWTLPCEIEHPIRFEEDHRHAAYDADFANRFWRVLVQADRVLTLFRAGFLGKVSPVHFFWGSFDLAVTRFRPPGTPHPGAPNAADKVTREAFARSQQRRLLAWPGRPVRSGLLRVRISGAGRVRAGSGRSCRGFLRGSLWRVPPAV
jgi:hypothetical protein